MTFSKRVALIISIFSALNVTCEVKIDPTSGKSFLSSHEKNTIEKEKILERSKRQLLFPNSTLFQFNVGIGVPVALKEKVVNVNWAFQANFQLPWNRSQIPIDILEANSGYVINSRNINKRNSKMDNVLYVNEQFIATEDDNTDKQVNNREQFYDDEIRLYHLYQYIEEFLNMFGHNGRSCVLLMFCQLGAEPLHSEDPDDILHELASLLLDPTIEKRHTDALPYIAAIKHGKAGKACWEDYPGCSISLIDFYSKVYP